MEQEGMVARHVRAQAVGEFGEVKLVEVGRDGLGNSVEGAALRMDLAADGRAGRDVDVDSVEGAAELDGDPGGGGLGGHGERVATGDIRR